MSKVRHLGCPHCGAAIGISELSRIIRCGHCESKLLVDGHPFVSEYYAEPQINRTAARRRVQRALSGREIPKGLLGQSRLDSAALCFVPYNELFARRVGKVVMRTANKEMTDQGQRRIANTRVVISDVERIAPAVPLDDHGLEHTALKQQERNLPFALLPTTREALAKKGRIYHPSIAPDHLIEQLETGGEMSDSFKTKTEYVERRYRRIYYPVWRIRYWYQKRYFWATVDGVTGEMVTLRAPQSDRSRLKWLLGTAMFTALILGKSLRAFLALFDEAGPGAAVSIAIHPLTLIVALFALGFLVLLLSVGWEQFRYSGELVFTGDTVEVIKLNKPKEEPWAVRLVVDVLERVGAATQPKEKHL